MRDNSPEEELVPYHEMTMAMIVTLLTFLLVLTKILPPFFVETSKLL